MQKDVVRGAVLLVAAATFVDAALGAQAPAFDVTYEYSADGTRGTKTVQPGAGAGFTFVSRPGGLSRGRRASPHPPIQVG